MLQSFFLTAYRNLSRNKLHSFINITGLALGIVAFLLILQYVSFERSVNGFHQNMDNMYRLLNEDQKGVTWGEVEPGWAKRAKESFPEIVDYCRFEANAGKGVVRREETSGEPFREENVGYAEGNFFSFFSFPVLKGTAGSFNKPNVVFVSEETVKKYFGTEEPMGKTLSLFNQFGKNCFFRSGCVPYSGELRHQI